MGSVSRPSSWKTTRTNRISVNKVIVSQGSLSRFINYVSPGAYFSLTHIDFSALDQLLIKPVGVYGSKPEIVRLLRAIKAVDEDTYALLSYNVCEFIDLVVVRASLLLMPHKPGYMHDVPSLASGLYIFEVPSEVEEGKRFYVVYWPEDTTWDDNATSSVAKNRVTFIRQARSRHYSQTDLCQYQISHQNHWSSFGLSSTSSRPSTEFQEIFSLRHWGR